MKYRPPKFERNDGFVLKHFTVSFNLVLILSFIVFEVKNAMIIEYKEHFLPPFLINYCAKENKSFLLGFNLRKFIVEILRLCYLKLVISFIRSLFVSFSST